MKTKLLAIATLILASTAARAAESKSTGSADAAAAFARLKTLVGEWQADTQMGKTHMTYELIANGTALVERETFEKMQPMMTVYHLDGNRLLLTHYCMAGNQPRMQATAFNPDTGELQFQFLDASNLSGPGAGHMRNATIRIPVGNSLVHAWQFYEDGRFKTTETAQYTRVR